MQPEVKPKPAPVPSTDADHYHGEGYRVTLFNDDHHTFEQVATQIMKALRCSPDTAISIMMRAHLKGAATVIIAEQPVAQGVADVLQEIHLTVSVDRV